VPALKAHHAVALLGQPVHDFAFSFVAPLCAENYNTFTHIFRLFSFSL